MITTLWYHEEKSYMPNVRHVQALIIGGGPAAYTAGIYLSRAKREPFIIEGFESGGQLMLTSQVENFPGFSLPILGPHLMQEMRGQALACGAVILPDEIKEVNLAEPPFMCHGRKNSYTASVVVIATGARTRWLGLESEAFFRGYGVSSCATCDASFFRDKDVVVTGGGDSAAEEALHLAQQVKHVTLVHRRDRLRASQIMQDRLFQNPKISFIWDSIIEDIEGSSHPKAVAAVLIKNVKTGKVQRLPASGLFVAIGHVPNTDVFKPWVELDEQGYIVGVPDSGRTSREGIFVAGDVKDKKYRQAVTAAAQGCMAAMDADRYLQERGL